MQQTICPKHLSKHQPLSVWQAMSHDLRGKKKKKQAEQCLYIQRTDYVVETERTITLTREDTVETILVVVLVPLSICHGVVLAWDQPLNGEEKKK